MRLLIYARYKIIYLYYKEFTMNDRLHLQKLYLRKIYPHSDLSLAVKDNRVIIEGTLESLDVLRDGCTTGPMIPLSVALLKSDPDEWDREFEYYYDLLTDAGTPATTLLSSKEWMELCHRLAHAIKLREMYFTLAYNKILKEEQAQ